MMGRELRQAIRSLLVRPGRTLVALLILALGIGANAAIFSLVHAVFLQALPYPEAHRFVAVEPVRAGHEVPLSYLNYLDLYRGLVAEAEPPVFEELSIFARAPLNVTVGDAVLYVETELVSADYFTLLGHEPRLGRRFTAVEDALPRGRNVAILSDGFWRGHFADRPFTDGIFLRINGEPFEVVGVMAPDFRGLTDSAQLWVPVTSAATLKGPGFLNMRAVGWLKAVGRLAPGESAASTAAAASAVMARLEQEFPDANRGQTLRLRTLREAWLGDLYVKVRGLAASAALVLVLACVNVSGLFWARTLERRREIALRGALGATRWRLVRRLLTECLVLALAGSLLALILVRWTLDALLASSPLELRSFVSVGVGPSVAAATLAVGLATSLVFGLLPALAGTKLDLSRELAEGGGSGRQGGRRLDLLVMAQVALAFVLLYGALVSVDRFQRLAQIDLGYRTDRLVTMRVNLWGEDYAPRLAKVRAAASLMNVLRVTPEIKSAELVGPYMPGEEDWQTRRMTVVGWQGDPQEATSVFQTHRVSSGYFELMEIDFLDGEAFQVKDAFTGPLMVIVSAAAAERCWPGQHALGRRLKMGTADAEAPTVTVVGVVDDVAAAGFGKDSGQPHLYLFMAQFPPTSPPTLNVLLRTVRDPDEALLSRLRDTVQAILPDLPTYDVTTMEARLEAQLSGNRFLVLLLMLFTALALVLAAAGVYALASSRLASRTRELAVRLALGCTPSGLVRRTLSLGLVWTLWGSLAGAVLTLAAVRVLEQRLDEALFEPSLMAAVAAALAGLSLVASAWPAWRAARLDPVKFLREE